MQDFFGGQLLLPNLLTFSAEKQTRNKQNWAFYMIAVIRSQNRYRIKDIKDIWFYVFYSSTAQYIFRLPKCLPNEICIPPWYVATEMSVFVEEAALTWFMSKISRTKCKSLCEFIWRPNWRVSINAPANIFSHFKIFSVAAAASNFLQFCNNTPQSVVLLDSHELVLVITVRWSRNWTGLT